MSFTFNASRDKRAGKRVPRQRGQPQDECGAGQPSRGGFTLVEMLVAVVILAVGVLGLAATSATVLRQMTGANMQSRASQIAASRIELLSGRTCPALGVAGSATTGAVTETWNVAPAANQTLNVTVSVTFAGRTNPEQFRTVIACF
jgi:prepilin-type N-terminal cleavage/methylation domain-containing protein